MSEEEQEKTGGCGCAAKLGMFLLLTTIVALLFFLIIAPELRQRGINVPGVRDLWRSMTGKVAAESSSMTEGTAGSSDPEKVPAENEVLPLPPESDSSERSDPAVESWY